VVNDLAWVMDRELRSVRTGRSSHASRVLEPAAISVGWPTSPH